MLQCGVRTGWKAHGEVKAQVVLTEIHPSQSRAGHNKVQVSTRCKGWKCMGKVLEHSDVGMYLWTFLEGQAPSVCPHRVPRGEHQLLLT